MPVVLIEKQSPQITVITLNRPERRNALTLELLTQLCAAIKVASDEPQKRVVILCGAGAAFCTGLDLKEAAEQTKAHATAEMVANTLIAISQTHLVTIAAVHGAAVAGGAGIMSACDFVVAAERTKIGYPEVRRGLVAGLVMTFLRRQVGERNMRELLLGSELIEVERAKAIGLVNRVVARNDLMTAALKFADSVLQGAPSAVAQARKRLGKAPLEWLFVTLADAWGHQSAREYAWRGLSVYGVDGSSLRVVCGRRQIRRLFGLTRLDQVVPLAASLAEILKEAAEADAEAV